MPDIFAKHISTNGVCVCVCVPALRDALNAQRSQICASSARRREQFTHDLFFFLVGCAELLVFNDIISGSG